MYANSLYTYSFSSVCFKFVTTIVVLFEEFSIMFFFFFFFFLSVMLKCTVKIQMFGTSLQNVLGPFIWLQK